MDHIKEEQERIKKSIDSTFGTFEGQVFVNIIEEKLNKSFISGDISHKEFELAYDSLIPMLLVEKSIGSYIDNIVTRSLDISGLLHSSVSFIEKSFGTYPFDKDNESEDINKSDIAYAFSRSKESLFSMKGSDIKQDISNRIGKIEAKSSEATIKLASLQQKIGLVPDENHYDYESIENLPRKYSWELIDKYRGDESCMKKDSNTYAFDNKEESKNEVNEEKGKAMREYNDCVYSIVSCQRELKKLNILKGGFKDNKTYPLTPEQMMALKG